MNTLKIAGVAGTSLLLSKVKPEWGQQFLFENLKKFPGVPAKFSQWLEQKWEVKSEFSKPLMSIEIVREVLASEVPEFLQQVESISSEAWVASIGQVHQVQMLDGRELVVKVQYPGLAEEVSRQIDQLVWMMEQSPAKNFGFDAETWRRDLHAMFSEELDYCGELKRQTQFAEVVGSDAWVLIPKVYKEWSSKRVLVQECLRGQGLDELLREPKLIRESVANELARVLIRSFLSMPLLHGDLQPKNWAWCSKREKIILYDFGSCIEWDSNKQRLFESLVESVKTARDQAPMDYLVALGFDRNKLILINTQLPTLIESFLEPFWNHRLSRLSEWQVQKATQDILGDQSWYFRTAGPPWFLWVMRSLASVFYALKELSDRVPMASIFVEEQTRLDRDRWAHFNVPSQKEFIEQAAGVWSNFAQQSQFLHIRVTEGTEEIVSMRFPIQALQRLEDLMNPELMEKIKEQGLDLDAIKAKALRSGLIKQDLFNLKKDRRLIRIWIA